MGIISEEDKEYLREEFEKTLERNVEILYFQEQDKVPEYSLQAKELLEEIASLNDKVALFIESCNDTEKMKSEALALCPSIKIKSERRGFINFYGIPAGHEFISLVEAIKDMGSDNLSLPEDVIKRLKEIKEPIDIKVFISHSCPYCPGAVRNAHKFSLVNENIKGSMVDANHFRELSIKYGISSVPHIIVNDKDGFTGNMPPNMFLDKVEKALK